MAGGIKVPIVTKFDDRELKKAERTLKDFSSKFSATVGVAFAAAGYAAVSFGRDAILAAEDVQVANNRIQNIADSMGIFGNAADDVSQRLIDFAGANEMITATDAEVIKGAQAKLLTFQQLAASAGEAGGSFDRATIAAIDLAAAGFGSVESNATQLGKALQDPIKGLTALTRSGVTFTAEQKNLIATLVESGNTLAAQDIILSAIEQQVGGTAAATATASEKIALAFDNLAEQVGATLLPAFEQIIPILEEQLPAVGDAINNALAQIDWASVINGLANTVTWVLQNIDGLTRLAQVLGIAAVALTTLTIAVNVAKAASAVMVAVQTGLTAAFGATAAGVTTATIALRVFKAALITTGVGAIIVALGYVAEGFMNAGAAGEDLNETDLSGLQGQLNGVTTAANNAANAVRGIPGYPGSGIEGPPSYDPETVDRPTNPKPGAVHTWSKWDSKKKIYVWYQQTWNGSKWSKSELMTYEPPSGGGGGGGAAKPASALDSFFKDLNDQIAKQKAAIKLADLGISSALVEKILGSGADWQEIYDYIRKGGKAAADEVQNLFDQTEEGLAAAKKAAEELAAETQRLVDGTMAKYDRLLEEYEANQEAIQKLNADVQDLYDSFQDTFAVEQALGAAEQAVVDLTRGLRDLVAAQESSFMSDKQKKRVTEYLNVVEAQMREVAVQRDELDSRLKAVKDTYQNYFDSILGAVDITQFKGKSDSIIKQLRKQVEAQAKFQQDIQKLRAAGLSDTAIEQIQKAGAQAGGATAAALLSGGEGAISEVNSLYAQLGTIATQATEAQLAPIYGAGVDLSNGLIAGLESQAAQLKIVAEGLALDFADTFERVLNKNIVRLRKPDLAAWQQYAADLAAFQQALAGTLQPGEQVGYNSGDIVNGLLVPTPPRPIPGSAGSIQINVNAGLGTNGQEVGRLIVEEIRKYEKRAGQVFIPAPGMVGLYG